MNKSYSETIFEMYLDFLNNYLSVEKFVENNLLSVDHVKQLLVIAPAISQAAAIALVSGGFVADFFIAQRKV